MAGSHRTTRPARWARRVVLFSAALAAVGGGCAWATGLYATHARAAGATVESVSVTRDSGAWRTAWALSLGHEGGLDGTDLSCRMVVRPAMSGSQIRFRLVNYPARSSVTFSHLVAAPRTTGLSVDADARREVTVGGQSSVTLAPGAEVLTDPVDLPVERDKFVVLSIAVSAGTSAPWHYWSPQTNGCTQPGSGDVTLDESGSAFSVRSEDRWLSAVQVLPGAGAAPVTTVGAYGDSLTDGVFLAPDTYRRWTDRLEAESAGRLVVLNYGVSGDRISGQSRSGQLPLRVARDVLTPAGMSIVIVEMGSNDIRHGASANAVLEQYRLLAQEVTRAGKQLIVATVPPRNDGMPAAAEVQRRLLNEGLRRYPLVADIDAALTDPTTGRLYSRFDIGDHIHPNPAGVAVITSVMRQALIDAGGTAAASLR